MHLLQYRVRCGNVAARITIGKVDIDVAGKKSVFVANHGGSAANLDRSQFAEGRLVSAAGGYQHPAQCVDAAAEIAHVTDVYGIALGALIDGRNVVTADGIVQNLLRLLHADAVLRELLALPYDVEEIALIGALREHAARSRNRS